MSDVVTELKGEFRTPRNLHQGAGGSIHNDATASKLGFKGGTVPGSEKPWHQRSSPRATAGR